MPRPKPDTDELLRRADTGDASAVGPLLDRHRDRLRRMITVRIDPRLAARVDPSDVVQEAFAEASQKLPDYLRDRPLPFYPWLRQIAWQRLVRLHQRHIGAQKRTVNRECHAELALPDESVMQLANRLVASGTSPSRRAIREELRGTVRAALDRMAPHDREILVMWYLEQLSVSEIAALMEMTETAVKSRHRRALQRLLRLLEDDAGET